MAIFRSPRGPVCIRSHSGGLQCLGVGAGDGKKAQRRWVGGCRFPRDGGDAGNIEQDGELGLGKAELGAIERISRAGMGATGGGSSTMRSE